LLLPYFYPKIGGLENYALNIAKGLKEKYNWDVFVVTSNHESSEYIEDRVKGIKVYRLSRWFKVSNTPINPLWYWQLRKIIRKENPDIINGHSPVPFMADMAARAARAEKVPFVLGYHFPSMKRGNIFIDSIVGFYEKIILKKTSKLSSKIICSSEYVRKIMFKDYDKKCFVITQGIDTKLFKPNKKVKCASDLLFVGNFSTKIKGLHLLLESLSKIKKNLPDIKLNVVGKGDTNKYLLLCKSLGISENVKFKGELSGKNIANEYLATKAVVIPSLIDNLPSVILEAMACGKPVIGTNVGSISEVLKNNYNGLLIPPDDLKKLTKSILFIQQEKFKANQMSLNGIKDIEKRFIWSKKIRKTYEVLK
jgi:glycosyltransferase involved in cell wall biosynthesis